MIPLDYDAIVGLAPPVPREIVAAQPYDAHLPEDLLDAFRQTAVESPWAASGHYGKELGLVLAGHKKAAIVEWVDARPHWFGAMVMRRFVFRDVGHSLYVAVVGCEVLLDALEHGDWLVMGAALGYQPVAFPGPLDAVIWHVAAPSPIRWLRLTRNGTRPNSPPRQSR